METINVLRCPSCGATCDPKDRKRFASRHPKLCTARRDFNRQLAQGTRSTEPTTWEEHEEARHEGQDSYDYGFRS